MSRPVQCSFLLLVFTTAGVQGATKLPTDAVTSLPGLPALTESNYAGHVPVGERGGEIFYWLSEARSPSAGSATPLLLWLNGGPGSSSLTGFFFENGPYRFDPTKADTIIPAKTSWNEHYHVVYVDQPVGTGYSYCPADNCYATTLDSVGDQMVDFFGEFFKLHPELSKAPLFLTGESFAGKYIPHIAQSIIKHGGPLKERLSGLAIGNPEIDTLLQYPPTATYLRVMGLLGDKQEEAAKASFSKCAALINQSQWKQATDVCEKWLDALIAAAGNPFRYDIRLYKDWTDDAIHKMGAYLNSDPVKSALHVKNFTWNSGDGEASPNKVSIALADEIEKPGALDVLGGVLNTGLRVLVYDGNQDGSPFNHLSTEAAMEHMTWTGQKDFLKAGHDPIVLPLEGEEQPQNGTVYLRAAAGASFGFMVVPNAGHLVPTDQPALASAMIEAFVGGKILLPVPPS
jgi:carboxypeptidase C (cathepsin A)